MAEVILGVGTSHSPMLSLDPKKWSLRAEADRLSVDLADPDTGEFRSFADLLAARRNRLRAVNEAEFETQWLACQTAISALNKTIKESAPDVLVIVSDDQDELLYDDNMPMFQIFWGDSIRLIPRYTGEGAALGAQESAWGFGDVEMDVPVAAELGLHLVKHLRAQEFDIAQSRYLRPDYQYGGVTSPTADPARRVSTRHRRQGIGHGWGFVIKRLLDNAPIPIVPVIQNTCYPPNTPTAARCYKFGKAIRAGIESWSCDKRVAVIASGGLSHFVTDETIDRLLLDGILNKRADVLSALPEQRLQSAASEIKNWVTCAAACEHLEPNLLDYVPVYRTEAGTGGGWAFLRWL